MLGLGNYIIYVTSTMEVLRNYVICVPSGMAVSGTIWAPPQSDPSTGARKARKNINVCKNCRQKYVSGAKNYEKLDLFEVFEKCLKWNGGSKGGVEMCKIKWLFHEVFWKSSSPSTVPVQQRIPDHISKIPSYDKGSLHICVRTYMLKIYSGKRTWKRAWQ